MKDEAGPVMQGVSRGLQRFKATAGVRGQSAKMLCKLTPAVCSHSFLAHALTILYEIRLLELGSWPWTCSAGGALEHGPLHCNSGCVCLRCKNIL